MRKIRSIAVSVATALLMTFMVALFMPGFAFKVNAADVVGRVIYEADGFDYKTQHDPLLNIFE